MIGLSCERPLMPYVKPSAKLFAILVYYFEERDVDFGTIVGHKILVNSTDDMAAVIFDSILQSSAGLTYVGEVTIFSCTGAILTIFCLICDGILSL